MRLPVLTVLFTAAVLFGENIAATAQSVGPYWYPWCGIYDRVGGNNTLRCYFDTRAQCMESISGIGGLCVENLVPPPPRSQVTKSRKPIK